MANVRINDVTEETNPSATDKVLVDGVNTRSVTLTNAVNAARPFATQPEAEEGVSATTAMSPLTTKQAIDAQRPAGTTGLLVLDAETPADARTVLELGTAATSATGDFATAAQGTLADTAVQPADLATVATTGQYTDLAGTPTLGTAAAQDSTAFATAAQGLLADSAVQPGDGAAVPIGGTTGQVLAKASATDGDTFWTAAGTGDVLSTNNGSDFANPLAVPGNIGAMPVATYDPNAVAGDAFDSGNHSFTPTVPAAAARTVADKLNDVRSLFDLIPDLYRTEIGDGTGANGLQSYFKAAAEQKGRWYVPRGRYYFTGTALALLPGHVDVIFDPDALVVAASTMTSELFQFKSSVEYAYRPHIHGGHFDVSAVATGNGGGANAGTAVHLVDCAQGWLVTSGRYIAGTDLDNLMGDTAVGVTNCLGGTAEKNYARGFGDLAFYITGGNALDRSQEGGPTTIHDNIIEQCFNAVSGKRGAAGLIVTENNVIRCNNGIAAVEVGGDQNLTSGHHFIIADNWVKDTVFSPVSLRGGIGRHKVHGNIIEDWGYGTDDLPTASTSLRGIDARGARNSTFEGNTCALVDRAKTTEHRGLVFSNHVVGATTYEHGGNLVTDNQFENLAESVREEQAGDAALLNEVRDNHHKNVTTRYMELTTGAFFYDTWTVRDIDLGVGSIVASGQSATINYAVPGLRSGGTVALTMSATGAATFDARIDEIVLAEDDNMAVKIFNGSTVTQDFTNRRFNATIRS